MAVTLELLCAGAAQGLVGALQARFLAQTGATLRGRFGAVGAMTTIASVTTITSQGAPPNARHRRHRLNA